MRRVRHMTTEKWTYSSTWPRPSSRTAASASCAGESAGSSTRGPRNFGSYPLTRLKNSSARSAVASTRAGPPAGTAGGGAAKSSSSRAVCSALKAPAAIAPRRWAMMLLMRTPSLAR